MKFLTEDLTVEDIIMRLPTLLDDFNNFLNNKPCVLKYTLPDLSDAEEYYRTIYTTEYVRNYVSRWFSVPNEDTLKKEVIPLLSYMPTVCEEYALYVIKLLRRDNPDVDKFAESIHHNEQYDLHELELFAEKEAETIHVEGTNNVIKLTTDEWISLIYELKDMCSRLHLVPSLTDIEKYIREVYDEVITKKCLGKETK